LTHWVQIRFGFGWALAGGRALGTKALKTPEGNIESGTSERIQGIRSSTIPSLPSKKSGKQQRIFGMPFTDWDSTTIS
jgi:hypothetical protein